jgi:ferredoxin-NADP reductase
VAAHPEGTRGRTLRLQLPAATPPHIPGQHYAVRTARDDGSWAQRLYSVASAPERSVPPGAGRHVELTVDRLDGGELSPYLHQVQVGSRLQLRGPFGGWFIWRGEAPALLLGGGSGVVPLMSMHRHWRAVGEPVPLRMVVSIRTPQDIWYPDELGTETTLVFTRAAPEASVRPPGRLDADLLGPLLIPGATCYVCGSAGFAEHASRLLVDLGVSAGDVRVERFGPS